MFEEASDSKPCGTGASAIDQLVLSADAVPTVHMSVPKGSAAYKMDHSRRGLCLIFTYESYDERLQLKKRIYSSRDVQKCEKAFTKLGFQTEVYLNLTKKHVEETLVKASQDDTHKVCDAFILIFMSHGCCEPSGKEYLWTKDAKIDTSLLWKNFTADNCASLAGKPKLFFIQACRGNQADFGVHMISRPVAQRSGFQVIFPGEAVSKIQQVEDYRIPSYTDFLTMWASYPGHLAFNAKSIRGSVFIHYLANILEEKGGNELLIRLLTEVTRTVSEEYVSDISECIQKDKNKQTPFFQSTLTRDLVFWPKSSEEI